MLEPIEDRVSLAPFRRELSSYSWTALRLDLQAGLTVAVFAVPQVMAYAMLAGLAPAYGLYATVIMSITAALWGSSPFVNTGPTNSAALLTGAVVISLSGRCSDPVQLVFNLIILVGLIRLSMGLFRMGWILRYVPESALIGFTAGAAFLIAMGQLHHLLGIPASKHPYFLVRMGDVLGNFAHAQPASIAIGIGTLAIMLIFDRYAKKWPIALLAIAAGTLAAQWSGVSIRLVRDFAPVPANLAGVLTAPFDLTLLPALLPAAVSVAMIGLTEAISIGELLALKHRRHTNINQEFFGQGLSQIVAAFFHGFPGSGSFSRSALIEQTGGKTCLANVFFGLATAAAVVLFPSVLNLIPLTSLSGLLLYIGYKLIDVKRIKRVFETSAADAIVMVVTAVVTVFINIAYGLFAGIIVAVFFYFYRVTQLRICEIVPGSAPNQFEEISYEPGTVHERSDLAAISVNGELFFGVARELREQLEEIRRLQKPRIILLRVRRAYTIDFSCWNALFEFAEVFHEEGGRIYLCGVRPDFEKIIRDARMEKIIPPSQVFPSTAEPFHSFHAALETILRQCPADTTLSPAWRATASRASALPSCGGNS